MPSYRCDKGCVYPAGKKHSGQRVWHRNRTDCPREANYREPIGASARPVFTQTAPPGPAPTVAPGAQLPLSTPAPASAPGTAPAAPAGAVQFGGVPQATLPPGQAQAPTERNWVVSEGTARLFANTVFNFGYHICHAADEFLEVPANDQIKIDSFRLKPAEENLFFEWAREPISTFLWKAGYKSEKAASRAVSAFSGMATFGMLGIEIFFHFVRVSKTSPRLQKMRAERERKVKEEEALALKEGRAPKPVTSTLSQLMRRPTAPAGAPT